MTAIKTEPKSTISSGGRDFDGNPDETNSQRPPGPPLLSASMSKDAPVLPSDFESKVMADAAHAVCSI